MDQIDKTISTTTNDSITKPPKLGLRVERCTLCATSSYQNSAFHKCARSVNDYMWNIVKGLDADDDKPLLPLETMQMDLHPRYRSDVLAEKFLHLCLVKCIRHVIGKTNDGSLIVDANE